MSIDIIQEGVQTNLPFGNTFLISGMQVENAFCNGILIWGVIIPPTSPQNFNATDDLEGRIICTWDSSTEGLPAPIYDLYKGISAVATNIVGDPSGNNSYTYYVTGTDTYHVKAINQGGSAPSLPDEGTGVGVPSYINNFEASGGSDGPGALIDLINMTWSASVSVPPVSHYDIYENGSLLDTVTNPGYVKNTTDYSQRTYWVIAVNEAGETKSNEDQGAAIAQPITPAPTFPNNDFTATGGADNPESALVDSIEMDWSAATNTMYYHVYSTQGYIAQTSGTSYTLDELEPGYENNFYVRAIGESGDADSVSNPGSTIVPLETGSVTIDFDGYTSTGNGFGTVVGGNGVFSFQAPDDNTYTISVMGAGGGGNGGQAGDTTGDPESGDGGFGGKAGSPSSGSADLLADQVVNNIIVGAGGTGGEGGGGRDGSSCHNGDEGQPGLPGTSTSILGVSGSGGDGGAGHVSNTPTAEDGEGSCGGAGGVWGGSEQNGTPGGNGTCAGGGGGGGGGGDNGLCFQYDSNSGGPGGTGAGGQVTISW